MTPTESWMCTHGGRQFYPFAPRAQDVAITDIAHALSNICRYTGHVAQFYSVAQHCVYVSTLVHPAIALEGLLHDASEAYLSDLARPVKPFVPQYKEFEERIEEQIAIRFGLRWPWPEDVKRADNEILRFEIHSLMPPTLQARWPLEMYQYRTFVPIEPLPPHEARQLFMQRYYRLIRLRKEQDSEWKCYEIYRPG